MSMAPAAEPQQPRTRADSETARRSDFMDVSESRGIFRRPGTVLGLLRDALGLQKQQQVIATAGLGVRAAHVEAAERMAAHDRSGALAVHVEVPDEELTL